MLKIMKYVVTVVSVLFFTACSQGVVDMTDKSLSPCGDKPNCVSTLETREKHAIDAFTLTEDATLEAIETEALKLKGARTVTKDQHYLRIECTSTIMRFVDDLELRIDGNNLVVRSESRVGHSDFGVNRKRADSLRSLLKQAGLIQ
jgi:uncharacterized protein (DUF1499 family)